MSHSWLTRDAILVLASWNDVRIQRIAKSGWLVLMVMFVEADKARLPGATPSARHIVLHKPLEILKPAL